MTEQAVELAAKVRTENAHSCRLVQAGAGLATLLVLAGCSGWQSAMTPQGPDAGRLAWLIWTFTFLLTAIWLAVLFALAIAVWKRRIDPALLPPPPDAEAPGDRRGRTIVAVLTVATALTVIGLSVLSFLGQRALFAPDRGQVTIQARGYQWWWEFHYLAADPDAAFATANEIHVPVGVPVRLVLTSNDVIHSFWVPNLFGKQDLIPGQENEITFTATSTGTYRGQCAEFCGLQHAHMSLLVVVEDQAAFEAWRTGQARSADLPEQAEGRMGAEVFVERGCLVCHTIRGTIAAGRNGPDLTHLGSRRYLAAATLPLTRGSLAAWIADPHAIKPGVNMPAVPMEPDELNALVGYLEGLH